MKSGKRGAFLLPALIFILTLAVVIAISNYLTYLFVPPEFTRAKIHSIETNAYDFIVFGTSHGVCAVDPDVITEETGKSCYNAAAGGLYPESTYFLVRDAAERGNVSAIIYEFDPTYWLSGSEGNPNEWYAFHYMKPSVSKLRFFADCAVNRDLRFTVMPWYMFEKTKEAVEENKELKASEDYAERRMALFTSGMNEARENGFYAVHGKYGTGSDVPVYGEFAGREVAKNRKYFEKTLAYCNEKHIPVYIVTTPIPEETAAANAGFYETAAGMMRDIAKSYDVTYYDFVTETGIQCPMPDRAYYDMEGHMHSHGAESFSAVLGELLPAAIQ